AASAALPGDAVTPVAVPAQVIGSQNVVTPAAIAAAVACGAWADNAPANALVSAPRPAIAFTADPPVDVSAALAYETYACAHCCPAWATEEGLFVKMFSSESASVDFTRGIVTPSCGWT